MSVINAGLKTRGDFSKLQEQLKKSRQDKSSYIAVCGDTGCTVWGSKKVKNIVQDYLEKKGLGQKVGLKFTGCLGLCESGPDVMVFPQGIIYQKVMESDVEEIIDKTVLRGEVIERLLYQDPLTGQKYVYADDIPFYKKQERRLIGNNWTNDPTSIEDYLSLNGYEALVKVLTSMSGREVIEEVLKTRLRGRGGAGFPTGLKWEECYEAVSDRKFIICNADEGDPGAFMDRSLLEGNPHSVLEGLIIGGYAIGAAEGIIYIRAEYPTAVAKVRLAIAQAEEMGLLGENILGSNFNFRVSVSIGAGAFVCGETSALVASVEGRTGEPRQKPPHLAERGYLNKPTVINNVETLANVPFIIRYGADHYGLTGTERSKGTKIFSLVGKIVNTGLVEVPLGMTLREIIFDIGGGIKDGKEFKAVQTGGPSGGCLPASLLDSPTDFEELSAAGSMMGSGGMIVMDEDTCMVDIARYFLSFLEDESCGSCFTCREGISRMLEMVEDITRGNSSLEQLELLKELAQVVKDSTMCGLGQTSANPVFATLRYFEDEYMAHIIEKRCPAGVCRDLITLSINGELCEGCGACLKKCPGEAIQGEKKESHTIMQDKCTKCGICLETCKFDAVIKQ
ncbi:MAG: NADH-ubiquinone oxidoreductase-F iron-sulfur binding region domain-containing protein [Bacillota bacterium]|nr:NADH-ubiquinone oxidoreductase-F iron-sulfur binding region domain-containing protein [Bacillota bacterium]